MIPPQLLDVVLKGTTWGPEVEESGLAIIDFEGLNEVELALEEVFDLSTTVLLGEVNRGLLLLLEHAGEETGEERGYFSRKIKIKGGP